VKTGPPDLEATGGAVKLGKLKVFSQPLHYKETRDYQISTT